MAWLMGFVGWSVENMITVRRGAYDHRSPINLCPRPS